MAHQNHQSETNDEDLKGCRHLVLGILGYLAVILVMILVIWKLFPLFFNFIGSALSVRWQRDLIGILVVFVCGYGLYFLRQKRRAVYGLVEIIFAIISTWFAINSIEDKPDITTWLALAGAIYLTVRGLDNFLLGKEELGNADNYFTILRIGKK
jgi:TRAP-type uncharacterized transport system fused permease subunit